jgi:hypothetical protein
VVEMSEAVTRDERKSLCTRVEAHGEGVELESRRAVVRSVEARYLISKSLTPRRLDRHLLNSALSGFKRGRMA